MRDTLFMLRVSWPYQLVQKFNEVYLSIVLASAMLIWFFYADFPPLGEAPLFNLSVGILILDMLLRLLDPEEI